MNEEEAVRIIHNCLVDIESIPVKLSLRKGIDYDQVKQLFTAMEFLLEQYENKKEVSKILAASFVDISPSFERSVELYNQDTQDKIIDLKDKIIKLALEILDAQPS